MALSEARKRANRNWRLKNPTRWAEYRRRYDATHPKAWKDYVLRATYGITLEQYNQILADQGGVCAICGGPPKKRDLEVDHDHATGRVRGLLCHGCNVGIGFLCDSADLALRAAAYLEKHACIPA